MQTAACFLFMFIVKIRKYLFFNNDDICKSQAEHLQSKVDNFENMNMVKKIRKIHQIST